MFKTEEYKLKVKEIEKTLQYSKEAMHFENLQKQYQEQKNQLEDPLLWKDLEKSVQLRREITILENKIAVMQKVETRLQEILSILSLMEESTDDELMQELETNMQAITAELEDLFVNSLLQGKYDACNAILSLHAGAGGTESCDWVAMLYRMFTRYAESCAFQVVEVDKLAGEEAGIKSVTFKVVGINAYGYLKAEKGVHRLVRISPFDANKRRHTSFASLEVMPEIENENEIQIKPDEIKVSTFRSSGAGGQHVNKTESAIRIQHLPTGIVVSCQNERSQIQNREMAMKMLRSKLADLQESQLQQAKQSLKGEMKKIEWGSQIRSYVFCPYTIVKDHRTGYENANVQAVMDGDLHPFILHYLKKS